jgi:hypothetical protein
MAHPSYEVLIDPNLICRMSDLDVPGRIGCDSEPRTP